MRESSARRIRRVAVAGTVGIALAYVVTSTRPGRWARTWVAGKLQHAWARSREFARAAVGDVSEPAAQHPDAQAAQAARPNASERPAVQVDAEDAGGPPLESELADGTQPNHAEEALTPAHVTASEDEGHLLYETRGARVLLPVREWSEEGNGESDRVRPDDLPARFSGFAAEVPVEDRDLTRGRRRWARGAGVAAAACAAAGVAAVSWAIWLSDSDGPRHAASPPQRTAAARKLAALAAVSQPDAQRIRVAGSAGKLILVVAPDGRAALIVSGVKRAPAGKQFEGWVIVGKTPKRAGLFSGGSGYIVVPLSQPVPKGATFAVTLEPAGGVDAPTSKPVFTARRL
jgi:anti-sigma-K factor RskA